MTRTNNRKVIKTSTKESFWMISYR